MESDSICGQARKMGIWFCTASEKAGERELHKRMESGIKSQVLHMIKVLKRVE